MRALLRSLPKQGNRRPGPLPTIPGVVPDLRNLEPGCRFRQRCAKAEAKCAEREPELDDVPGPGSGRLVRCFFPETEPLK